jgi:[amino group carrier protein]-L-2-aminoadipate 6-kinase
MASVYAAAMPAGPCVVKIGGSLEERSDAACADVAALVGRGAAVVVVHGGAAEADRLARELGRPPRHLARAGGQRSRYSDAPALDALQLAMLGRVKPRLVRELGRRGVPAVGLSAMDGGLVTAVRNPPARALVDGRPRVVRDDLSGRVAAVDVRVLRTLLDAGFVPVASPPACDAEATALNLDADRLAAAIAVGLRAELLIVLSDVEGLLRDPADPATLVREVSEADYAACLELARGRMRVKLAAAREALSGGVPHVVLADGRVPSPVLSARAGAGTRLVRGPAPAPGEEERHGAQG